MAHPARSPAAAIPDGYGGVALAGWSNSGGNTGSVDGWFLRLDAVGKVLTDVRLGTAKTDRFAALVKSGVSNDAYVLAGSSATNTTDDGWLVAVDKAGKVQWSKSVGGDGADVFAAVIRVPGGYLAVGTTGSQTAGGADGWLVRVGGSGEAKWQRRLGGKLDDRFLDVSSINNGWLLRSDAWGHVGCKEAGGCATVLAKTCDDGNPCTDDACIAKTSKCAHVANTAHCETKPGCSVGDKCSQGKCVASGKTRLWTATLEGGTTNGTYVLPSAAAETPEGTLIVVGTGRPVEDDGKKQSPGEIAALGPTGELLWKEIVGKGHETAALHGVARGAGEFLVAVGVVRADKTHYRAWIVRVHAGKGVIDEKWLGPQRTAFHDIRRVGQGFAVVGSTAPGVSSLRHGLLVRLGGDLSTLWQVEFGGFKATTSCKGEVRIAVDDVGIAVVPCGRGAVAYSGQGKLLWHRAVAPASSWTARAAVAAPGMDKGEPGVVLGGNHGGGKFYRSFIARVNGNGDTLWARAVGVPQWHANFVGLLSVPGVGYLIGVSSVGTMVGVSDTCVNATGCSYPALKDGTKCSGGTCTFGVCL